MQGRYKPNVAAVLADLMRGMPPKEAAMRNGMASTYPYKVARIAGLEPRYLTNEEWRAILARRKQSA